MSVENMLLMKSIKSVSENENEIGEIIAIVMVILG